MRTILFFPLCLLMISSCNKNNDNADAYGNFEAEEILISTEQTGKIIFFEKEEGDSLNSGEVICQIDTIPLQLKMDILQAQKQAILSRGGNISTQVDVLQQQKNNYQNELKRIDNLLKDGAATAKQRDEMEYQIKVVERQIVNIKTQNSPIQSEAQTIERQILQTQDMINRCKILCPINATIIGKYSHIDEIATPAKPLVKIANLRNMYLRAYVSGQQLSSIKIGQKVKVRIDNSKNDTDELEGTVTWISQQAEFTPKAIQTKEERVNLVYAIKVLVINDGRLKIGMPGEVDFQ